jgi:hypothetical protein
MPATDLAIPAASWLDRHDHQVTAAITLAVAGTWPNDEARAPASAGRGAGH